MLETDDSKSGLLARAVALRSKGLILRDLLRDLSVAIACHKAAVDLLKPVSFSDSKVAHLETVLNLAE